MWFSKDLHWDRGVWGWARWKIHTHQVYKMQSWDLRKNTRRRPTEDSGVPRDLSASSWRQNDKALILKSNLENQLLALDVKFKQKSRIQSSQEKNLHNLWSKCWQVLFHAVHYNPRPWHLQVNKKNLHWLMAYFYWQGIWGDGVVCFMLWMLALKSVSKAKCNAAPSFAYRDLHELVCLNWYAHCAHLSNDPGPEASPLLMICAESKT